MNKCCVLLGEKFGSFDRDIKLFFALLAEPVLFVPLYKLSNM